MLFKLLRSRSFLRSVVSLYTAVFPDNTVEATNKSRRDLPLSLLQYPAHFTTGGKNAFRWENSATTTQLHFLQWRHPVNVFHNRFHSNTKIYRFMTVSRTCHVFESRNTWICVILKLFDHLQSSKFGRFFVSYRVAGVSTSRPPCCLDKHLL